MSEGSDEGCLLGIPIPVNDSRDMASPFFPSKIGGKPAWLDLKNIPSQDSVICPRCGEQMQFLLQLYAPLHNFERCFHRTLYLFVCFKESCCKSDSVEVKAFRCQLGAENKFYPSDGPLPKAAVGDLMRNREKVSPICFVCGLRSDKRCAICKNTYYCSKEHQVAHWKAGHKNGCSLSSNLGFDHLLTEMEIEIVDEEPLDEISHGSNEDKEAARLMKEYVNISEKERDGGMIGEEDEKIFKTREDLGIDKQFTRCQERMKAEPSQVVRYIRDNIQDLLWVNSEGIPEESSDIPVCDHCGMQRKAEFQVMPQILYYLDTSSGVIPVEFGTIVVYTCPDSCAGGADTQSSYKEEYVWVQQYSSSAIK